MTALQVREAARLRFACLVEPALRRLTTIIRDADDSQALAITVRTQVNMPEARVANMSDQELDTYEKLLLELRELLPVDDPKKRLGTVER